MTNPDRCPCGTGDTLADCCGPVIEGSLAAPTAERLMRSRYTAFALGDTEYLSRSWHPVTRPRKVEIDPDQRWLFLEVLDTERGGLFDREGTVEFRAFYRHGGKRSALHERSRFVRVDKQWVYIDGVNVLT